MLPRNTFLVFPLQSHVIIPQIGRLHAFLSVSGWKFEFSGFSPFSPKSGVLDPFGRQDVWLVWSFRKSLHWHIDRSHQTLSSCQQALLTSSNVSATFFQANKRFTRISEQLHTFLGRGKISLLTSAFSRKIFSHQIFEVSCLREYREFSWVCPSGKVIDWT